MESWLKKQDKEFESRSLVKKLTYEKGLLDHMRNDEQHFDAKIINKIVHEGRKQKEYQQSMINEEKRKELLKAEKAYEERVSSEIQKQELQEFREEKLRQMLRLNCPELRELESKLKTAYVTMIRYNQFADKERIKAKERAERIQEAKEIDKQIQNYKEEKTKKVIDNLIQKRNYHGELDLQVEQKEQERFESYLQILQEKIFIDGIVKRVVDEEIAEMQKKLAKKKEIQEYIKDFKEAKQKSKKEEERRLKLENENIADYLIIQDLREKQKEEIKKYKLEVRERVKDELNKVLEEHYRNKNYENDLREELAIEEKEAIERKTDLEETEQRLNIRLQLQKAEALELRLKAEKLEQERLEEELFRQQMMLKLAEEEKLELMNDHKRRIRQIEHRKTIQKMIEEEKQKRMKDKLYDMQVYLKEQEMEKLRTKIIEQERCRMLEETAVKLLGYLPKNVIKNHEDLERLGVDFKHFYQRKPSYFDDNIEI